MPRREYIFILTEHMVDLGHLLLNFTYNSMFLLSNNFTSVKTDTVHLRYMNAKYCSTRSLPEGGGGGT